MNVTTSFRYLSNTTLVAMILSSSVLPNIANAQSSNTRPQNTPTTQTRIGTRTPRIVNNPNALFQPKVTIINSRDNSADRPSIVSQNTPFVPQTSPPPTSEERRASPPTPQDPRSIPPITPPVQPQQPGRVPGIVPPLRRLITPPVGDIAVSTFPFQPDQVDIASAVPFTFTGAGAPAQAVLAAMARQAGLNILFVPDPAAGAGANVVAGGVLTPITVDIRNVPVQQAFNDVLRLANLQASRIGDRIFVGARLPVNLQNIVTRSLRLNQVSVGDASAFLIGLGAERVVSRQRPIPGVQAATAIGPGGTAVVPPVQLEAVPVLERLSGDTEFSKLVLRGLQVVAEERGNSVTLIGPKNLVAFAEAQISRLDIRRRQVAVNVRVVEISLDRGQTFGTQFSFGVFNNSSFTFNTLSPNPISNTTTNILGTPQQGLLAQIFANQSNTNFKVLTDPTLIIQEGETAVVSLVETVLQRFIPPVAGAGEQASTPATITTADAGLVLNVNVARVDDNGFINLSVAPLIRAPGTEILPGGAAIGAGAREFSISTRSLTSGQIRIRDNQTLVLTGVIRDDERNSVIKIPLLGDIPLLGALFRFETNSTRRSEVVILVTPRIMDDSQNANWGFTYQPSPQTQQVIDSNQISLPQNQDNRSNRPDQR